MLDLSMTKLISWGPLTIYQLINIANPALFELDTILVVFIDRDEHCKV